uniref:Uncharacterized protein n=1 Tax=viral metagenome TaxID=1070528 RepID=A0A6H2A3R0_9ZZZZ
MRGPSFRWIITNCLLIGLAAGLLSLFVLMLQHDQVLAQEPVRAILVGETIAVSLIIVLGIANLIEHIGRFWNDNRR